MSYPLIFIFGLAIGSFLNVVICRLKTKETMFFKRSHCPKCRAVLKWYNLVPIFSFLIQRGKCQHCGQKISWQYPLVEIATGLLFVAVILNHSSVIPETSSVIIGLDPIIQVWIPAFAGMTFNLIIVSLLIVIFVYDLKHYIIPDRIIFPGIIISLIYLIYTQSLNHIWAGLIAGGFFLGLVLISKEKWMGWGDVKFAFLMGLILGWPSILMALFLSFLFGAIIGIILIVFGRKGMQSQIPFGPFLVGSTFLVIFIGQYLTDWYQILLFNV